MRKDQIERMVNRLREQYEAQGTPDYDKAAALATACWRNWRDDEASAARVDFVFGPGFRKFG